MPGEKERPMATLSEAEVLRVFVSELDKHGHRPLYEVVVDKARKRGLVGATVIRGIMGYGASGRLPTAKILRLSEDLPVVIEIVGKPERIEAFLPELDQPIESGLVAVQNAATAFYRRIRDGKSCGT